MMTVSVLGLTALMAGGTWLFGWMAVPILGLLWGALRRPRHSPGLIAAWGAGFGWGALLFWMSRLGPVGEVADRVGGITGLPATGVITMTVLFAALVAGTGASLSCAIVDRVFPEKSPPVTLDT